MDKIKGLQKTDLLMLVLVIGVLAGIDYGEMELQDTILAVCCAMWILMLGIRVYIENFRK